MRLWASALIIALSPLAFSNGAHAAATAAEQVQQNIIAEQQQIADLQDTVKDQLSSAESTSDPAMHQQISANIAANQINLANMMQVLQSQQASLASMVGPSTRPTDNYVSLPAKVFNITIVSIPDDPALTATE